MLVELARVAVQEVAGALAVQPCSLVPRVLQGCSAVSEEDLGGWGLFVEEEAVEVVAVEAVEEVVVAEGLELFPTNDPNCTLQVQMSYVSVLYSTCIVSLGMTATKALPRHRH